MVWMTNWATVDTSKLGAKNDGMLDANPSNMVVLMCAGQMTDVRIRRAFACGV